HDHISQFFQLLMDCAKKGRAFKKHTQFPFRSVGIVGVGLIGGSIAKAIKAKSNCVAVYCLKESSGSKLTILDGEFSDLETLAKAVEVIFLTVPLDKIIPLAHIIHQTGHSLCVIDVGSVKHPICEEFEELTKGNNEFIATHPMAGSEK